MQTEESKVSANNDELLEVDLVLQEIAEDEKAEAAAGLDQELEAVQNAEEAVGTDGEEDIDPDGTHDNAQLAEGEQPYRARIRSFVSRERALGPKLSKFFAEHAHQYVVEVPRVPGQTLVEKPKNPLAFRRIFGRKALVRVEIGSGNGDQIVEAARTHPDRDYLAFEVYHYGVAKTVAKAVKAGVTNLRIIEADAQQALPLLIAPESVDEVWTFFPDPWPKARHHKRRLVQPDFALEVAKILAPGGVWRLGTDWADYAFQMRDVIESCPLLSNPYSGMNPHPDDPDEGRGGFCKRWDGRVMTNFERRGLDAGRNIFDLTAQRL